MGVGHDKTTALGREGEALVAYVMNGEVTPHTHPVDVITSTQAIEVKTLLSSSAAWRTYMSPRARRRKKAWAKEHGLEPLTCLVVVHPSRFDLYIGQGFKSYDAGWMERIGTFKR